MFRIIILLAFFSGAVALNDASALRAKGLRLAAEEDPSKMDKQELKQELEELAQKLKEKKQKEQAKEEAVKKKTEELEKKVDAMIEEEKHEDKMVAKRQRAMKEEIKLLRKELEEKQEQSESNQSRQDEPAASKKKETEAASKAPGHAAKTPDAEAPESKVEVPDVFPVPTTSRCIVIMVCQYMVIYLALAVCRTYLELTGKAKGKVEAGLRAAAQTVTYGPMLCVLFIACRMRVEFLSGGKGEPQQWVQNCMYALTFAVLANTLLVLVLPVVTGKPLPLKEGSCDLERPTLSEGDSKSVFYATTAARYLILLGLYGGLAGVIVGICTYLPPGSTDLAALPPPAPAVMCTMILATAFFLTQLVIALCRSYTEFRGVELPKIVGMMNGAATSMEFAPMLAILFLAARMRALQHDGQPQPWAQNCMYAATGALCVTTILACLVPVVMGGTMKTNPVTKEQTFVVPNPMIGYVLVGVRFLCMFGFYGGAVGVACSIFLFEAPKGAEHTLPVSPTVHCVLNLACQFFFVYLVQTIMLTVSEVSGGRIQLEKYKAFSAVEAAKTTLGFAPMLAILFVTTRMYALLITDKKGAPPAWVQGGMYMATWSLLISFVTCLATGLLVDKVETDEDGNVVSKFSNKYVNIAMQAVRYLAMVMLYGGIVLVIVGLFVMTPETANGRGSIPVVSDVMNATPMGKPPPGPDAVANAPSQVGDAAIG